MNIKAFLVDALGSALELGIGTPEDVLRHVTPDVLSQHLPRPLWARLLTACLGAPRVDATLVVDTIGVPNLCEHIPAAILWACIAEIAARSLGKQTDAAVVRTDGATVSPRVVAKGPIRPPPMSAVLAPPPPPEERPAPPAPAAMGSAPVAIGPSIPAPSPQAAANQPLADLITELEQDGGGEPRAGNLRPRTPTATRFRQSNTAVGRGTLASAARRPQASASPTLGRTPRRSGTEVSDVNEAEPETAVESADWRGREIAVDDSQLVDWQADANNNGPAKAPSPITGDDDFSDLGRKR